jgi:hypothetical protein
MICNNLVDHQIAPDCSRLLYVFLPQLSLPLQLGFVELGTTFEKETLLPQFGLHLFACRDFGFLVCVCICFCLQKLDFLHHILYPFAFICFLRDWIPVLLFWMHLFASVLLAKIGFWYQNVAAALHHSTPTIISTHRRFPNVEGEFSMPATEQWSFWVP